MELKKVDNGMWKASVGTPEADIRVSLRQFRMQAELLEHIKERELLGQIACHKNRRGVQITQ